MLDVAQRNVTFLAPSPVAVTARIWLRINSNSPNMTLATSGDDTLTSTPSSSLPVSTKSTSNACTSISTNTGTLIVIVLGKSK